MSTKKSANTELVEQFIDALESYSVQLMDTVRIINKKTVKFEIDI
jgi:hypothetical protein